MDAILTFIERQVEGQDAGAVFTQEYTVRWGSTC
jgi:hypothetical protein